MDVFPLMLDILGLSPPPGYTAEQDVLGSWRIAGHYRSSDHVTRLLHTLERIASEGPFPFACLLLATSVAP